MMCMLSMTRDVSGEALGLCLIILLCSSFSVNHAELTSEFTSQGRKEPEHHHPQASVLFLHLHVSDFYESAV